MALLCVRSRLGCQRRESVRVPRSNESDKRISGFLVWFECKTVDDGRLLSGALGLPDLVQVPGWDRTPGGEAVIVQRAERVDAGPERPDYVALRVPEQPGSRRLGLN